MTQPDAYPALASAAWCTGSAGDVAGRDKRANSHSTKDRWLRCFELDATAGKFSDTKLANRRASSEAPLSGR